MRNELYLRLLAEAEMMLRQLLAEADGAFCAELEFRRGQELALYEAVRA